jgi:hypothetical protein
VAPATGVGSAILFAVLKETYYWTPVFSDAATCFKVGALRGLKRTLVLPEPVVNLSEAVPQVNASGMRLNERCSSTYHNVLYDTFHFCCQSIQQRARGYF